MLTLRYIYLLAVACATLSSAAPTIVGARQSIGTGIMPIVPGSGDSPSNQNVGPADTQPIGPAPPMATQAFGPPPPMATQAFGPPPPMATQAFGVRELDSSTNVMDNLDTAVPAPRDQLINLPPLFPLLSQ